MDKEYLEDYEQRENEQYERFMDAFAKGSFNVQQDRYPPDNRFIKLQRPVALAGSGNIWSQVPFSGSTVLLIPPISQDRFENSFFPVTKIRSIIDFIEETGRLQLALNASPSQYIGLDHLQPIFDELKPPYLSSFHISTLGTQKEIEDAKDRFYLLAKPKFNDFLIEAVKHDGSRTIQNAASTAFGTYVALKLCHNAVIEQIENLMIDNPLEAFYMLSICGTIISNPLIDLRSDVRNFSLEQMKAAQNLPPMYRPTKIRFPCEIGKFLLTKLTYGPTGLDSCKEILHLYKTQDLQNVQEALNEGILTNHPDIINKNVTELSEILDSVWNDKTIRRRVKGIQIGLPLSMAAIGCAAAGPIGAAGGFLAGLGYSVVETCIDLGTEGLSEKVAKLKVRSYQANIYNFEQKYKDRMVLDSSDKPENKKS